MIDTLIPETRFARSGAVSIAYQVMGNGPIDLAMVPGMISHIEMMHEIPGYTAFLRRLASFARVATFDKRGQGLSDRFDGAPTLEQRSDDVRAVVEACEMSRAAVLAISEGSMMASYFAAAHADQVSHLVFYGGMPRQSRAPPTEKLDFPPSRYACSPDGAAAAVSIGCQLAVCHSTYVRSDSRRRYRKQCQRDSFGRYKVWQTHAIAACGISISTSSVDTRSLRSSFT